MIVVISLALCVFLLFVMRVVVKDIKSPVFVLTSIWSIVYSAVFIYWNTKLNLNDILYSVFLAGLISFISGFALTGNKRGIPSVHIGERQVKLHFPQLVIQLVFIFSVMVILLSCYDAYKFIAVNGIKFNVWQTIGEAKSRGEYSTPIYMSYSRVPITVFAIILATIYYLNPTKINKRNYIVFTCIAFFCALLVTNRGAVFFLVISFLFSYLYIKDFDNNKLFKILMRTLIVILLIFISSSFAKFVYQDQSDTVSFINHHLQAYFANAPVAFVEWYKMNIPLKFGANSFRFFYAILGYPVGETTQEFMAIGDTKTNVFTFLHYYTADFGIFYAFFILFLLGFGYGYLYKKVMFSQKFSMVKHVLLSSLYFPLVYQFFSDTYFSLLSFWIQIVFWLWIFSQKMLLIRDK